MKKEYEKVNMKKNMSEETKTDFGFSLVELIVAVLIIAILAVSLAPQVLKWVHNSRVSSDIQTRNSVTDICKMALMDESAFAMVATEEYELHVIKDDTGAQHMEFVDKRGTHLSTDSSLQNDPYWKNLFVLMGADTPAEFESEVQIKSYPEPGEAISIDVYIYRGGYTYGYMEGVDTEIFVSS